MSSLTFWLTVGFLGQAVFTARFLVQWVVSERKRDSVVPEAFWWLSLVGGAALLSYAIFRRDPVIVAGQGMGLVVYTRNLMLVGKARRSVQAFVGCSASTDSVSGLKRPAQQPIDGETDIGSAHQGFADQDG
jgi:lipid-A-disaccharide synthase-like uncharacterized protein